MSDVKSKVEALLQKSDWQEERKKLRAILLDCALDEEVKWGKLCYCYENSNVVMIYGMKDNCALGFFKGALMKDDKAILEKPGENSRAMRWAKFTNLAEITDQEATLKAYIEEAVELEKAGAKIDFQATRELEHPPELATALDDNSALKTAFEALTPGRQRGYILHFSGAKQSATRASRIEKATPQILDGKGMHDR